MTLLDALVNIQLLYMDSAAFIYYIERNPSYVEKMRFVFYQVDIRALRIVTSVITFTEVLVKPIALKDREGTRIYRDLLRSTEGVSMLEVRIRIARRAALLRATYQLKTPDAIHIATAIEAKADAFLTNDLQLKRVSELPILVLSELNL